MEKISFEKFVLEGIKNCQQKFSDFEEKDDMDDIQNEIIDNYVSDALIYEDDAKKIFNEYTDDILKYFAYKVQIGENTVDELSIEKMVSCAMYYVLDENYSTVTKILREA